MKQKHTLFNQDERALAAFCKSMGHPARIRILQILMKQDSLNCKDIVKELPMAQSTVSQHLAELRYSGLINGIPDGVRMNYSFNKKAFSKDASELCNVLMSK